MFYAPFVEVAVKSEKNLTAAPAVQFFSAKCDFHRALYRAENRKKGHLVESQSSLKGALKRPQTFSKTTIFIACVARISGNKKR